MSQALAPLRRLQARRCEEHATEMMHHAREMEAFELRQKVAKDNASKLLSKNPNAAIDLPAAPIEPTLRRYIANDSNIASLGELLRRNSNGILVERDELVGLLRALED